MVMLFFDNALLQGEQTGLFMSFWQQNSNLIQSNQIGIKVSNGAIVLPKMAMHCAGLQTSLPTHLVRQITN